MRGARGDSRCAYHPRGWPDGRPRCASGDLASLAIGPMKGAHSSACVAWHVDRPSARCLAHPLHLLVLGMLDGCARPFMPSSCLRALCACVCARSHLRFRVGQGNAPLKQLRLTAVWLSARLCRAFGCLHFVGFLARCYLSSGL